MLFHEIGFVLKACGVQRGGKMLRGSDQSDVENSLLMKKHPRFLLVLERPARAGAFCSRCHLQGDGCPALEVSRCGGEGLPAGQGTAAPTCAPHVGGDGAGLPPAGGGHSPACPYPTAQRPPSRSHSCGARVRDALRRGEPGLEQHLPPALLELREALSAAGGEDPATSARSPLLPPRRCWAGGRAGGSAPGWGSHRTRGEHGRNPKAPAAASPATGARGVVRVQPTAGRARGTGVAGGEKQGGWARSFLGWRRSTPGERACLDFRSVRGRCLVILSTSLELALIPPQDKIKLWAVWSLFQRVALKGRKSHT